MAGVASNAQNHLMVVRIRSLREARGLSQEALAERAGISTSQVSRYESGKASLLHPGAERLAAALGCNSAADLLDSDRGMREVSLVGYVGAGAEIFPLDDLNETVVVPTGLQNPLAVIVRGSSMTPVYQENDILIADQISLPDTDLIGRDCIVQVHEGPRLIKRVLKGGLKGHFRLLSYQTMTVSDDLKLEWAVPVRWVKR